MVTAQQERSGARFLRTHGDGEADLDLDNSGRGPLLVPGFGHAVAIEHTPDHRFAHGFSDWAQDRFTAREMAMLKLMDDITDQPRWNLEARDAATVAQWASQALTLPLISQTTWDWCLAELRDKTRTFEDTGLVDIYDAASRICKSDAAISIRLLAHLESGVEDLACRRNVESGTFETTESAPELVDPNMFPLVYGQTRVLADGGRVGLDGAIDAIGQGNVATKQRSGPSSPIDLGGMNPRRFRRWFEHSWESRAYRFSFSFQWLPCEVVFSDGSATARDGPQIKISSYINNLHPRQNRSLYEIIEQCIAASIDSGNRVLVRRNRGRVPQRVRTHGPIWEPQYPKWTADLDDLPTDRNSEAYRDAWDRVINYLQQAENPRVPPPTGKELLLDSDWKYNISLSQAVSIKYDRIKRWLHPEPGMAFTYEDWKRGKSNFTVIPGPKLGEGDSILRKKDHEFYTISLQETFRDQGLQVVVEIGSIELTPEQPTRDATDWSLSGRLNEHIVATTIIFFSSTNVTPESASFSFRVEADVDRETHVFGPDSGSSPHDPVEPIADIYGIVPSSYLGVDGGADYERPGAGPAMQEIGPVLTPDGRLISFPNVMQHRIGACALVDPTRTGRRRFLRLHLVDPNYRICSTRNAPPQRNDW